MKSIKIILLPLNLLLFGYSITAQEINVGKEMLLSGKIDKPLVESHLIINPQDTNHLIAAAILQKESLGTPNAKSHIVLFDSKDQGKTWTTKHFDTDIELGNDPWLAMNDKGTIILTSLNRIVGKPYVYLLAFVSKDAGISWNSDYVNLGSGHDRQSVTIDPETQHFIIASSKYNRNDFNKVRDGLMISRLNSIGEFTDANWHALSNIAKNNGTPTITSDKLLLLPYVDFMVNDRMLETRRNWLLKSTNLGREFAEPILMSEGGTLPQILVDKTRNDRIYYLVSKGKFRDYSGFTVAYSNDGGESWSTQVDVTKAESDDSYIRNASWVLDAEGDIGIFWYDRRDDPDRKKQHIYFTYSSDGGISFAIPKRITSISSDPLTEMNAGTTTRFSAGGDYSGIVSIGKGKFQIVWSDSRNGYYQLFTTSISIKK